MGRDVDKALSQMTGGVIGGETITPPTCAELEAEFNRAIGDWQGKPNPIVVHSVERTRSMLHLEVTLPADLAAALEAL